MTVGERIEQRRKVIGISQAELARRSSLAQSTINGLIRGDSRSSQHLPRIARELGTSVHFLTGETDDPSEGALPALTNQTAAEQLDSVMVPIFDAEFSAGGGRFFDDGDQPVALEHHPFPKTWLRRRMRGGFDKAMLITARGDSMKDTIEDGDVLGVDRGHREVDEAELIWAFGYGNTGMVKRLRPLPKGGYLVTSDNAARFPPFEAAEDEIHVVGRVFSVLKWK